MSEDWRMDSDERNYLKDYFSDRKSVPTDKTKLDYPDAVNSKSVSYTHLTLPTILRV